MPVANFTPAMLAAQQASNAALSLDVRLKAALDAYELLHHERVRHGAMVERNAEVADRARKWWRHHVAAVHPGVLPEPGATLINLEGDPMYPAICNCPDGLDRLAESIQGSIEWGEMYGSG